MAKQQLLVEVAESGKMSIQTNMQLTPTQLTVFLLEVTHMVAQGNAQQELKDAMADATAQLVIPRMEVPKVLR